MAEQSSYRYQNDYIDPGFRGDDGYSYQDLDHDGYYNEVDINDWQHDYPQYENHWPSDNFDHEHVGNHETYDEHGAYHYQGYDYDNTSFDNEEYGIQDHIPWYQKRLLQSYGGLEGYHLEGGNDDYFDHWDVDDQQQYDQNGHDGFDGNGAGFAAGKPWQSLPFVMAAECPKTITVTNMERPIIPSNTTSTMVTLTAMMNTTNILTTTVGIHMANIITTKVTLLVGVSMKEDMMKTMGMAEIHTTILIIDEWQEMTKVTQKYLNMGVTTLITQNCRYEKIPTDQVTVDVRSIKTGGIQILKARVMLRDHMGISMDMETSIWTIINSQ